MNLILPLPPKPTPRPVTKFSEAEEEGRKVVEKLLRLCGISPTFTTTPEAHWDVEWRDQYGNLVLGEIKKRDLPYNPNPRYGYFLEEYKYNQILSEINLRRKFRGEIAFGMYINVLENDIVLMWGFDVVPYTTKEGFNTPRTTIESNNRRMTKSMFKLPASYATAYQVTESGVYSYTHTESN